MAARKTTFTVHLLAVALLAAAISAAGVNPAGAEAESAPAGPGRTAAEAIATGERHSCALLEDDSVRCWGYNFYGQLGLGDTASRGDNLAEMGADLPAVDLGPGRTATALAAGRDHTCALLDDATVKCWGANSSGSLGLGDLDRRGDAPGEMGANLPAVDLGPGRGATAITAGLSHTCAVLDDATVKCWGGSQYGQLGQGDVASRGDEAGEMGANLPVVDLGPGRTATAITAGLSHTCALLDNGLVKCWGHNLWGRLGLGDTDNRGDAANEMGVNLPPVDLGPGRSATAISGGSRHNCALLDDATVRCWGYNIAGQLGQGDLEHRGDEADEMGVNLLAVDLGPGRTATAITSASDHTCALLDDDTVKCWGFGGRLGLGDTDSRGDAPGEMGANLAAVDLGPDRRATAISARYDHTCALLDNDTVKCWGANSEGQLGQGDALARGDAADEMGANLASIDLGGRARSPIPPCPTEPHGFGDVSASSFAFADIACIKGLGITTGTSPTTYDPGGDVTREQMAAFLARVWRALGNTCSTDPHGFSDVSASSFAAADIACIKALGITTGTTPTTYSPGGNVTREQMAAFLARLWRALDNACPTEPHGFTDVAASSFAVADIACIKGLGITTGTTPTTYDPAGDVTREQMASFLARLWRVNRGDPA